MIDGLESSAAGLEVTRRSASPEDLLRRHAERCDARRAIVTAALARYPHAQPGHPDWDQAAAWAVQHVRDLGLRPADDILPPDPPPKRERAPVQRDTHGRCPECHTTVALTAGGRIDRHPETDTLPDGTTRAVLARRCSGYLAHPEGTLR